MPTFNVAPQGFQRLGAAQSPQLVKPGYVHRELVKYTEPAFEKTVIYKRHSRNHLLDQVESFRIGDRESDREDDLLDTFCYGIALALGNSDGF